MRLRLANKIIKNRGRKPCPYSINKIMTAYNRTGWLRVLVCVKTEVTVKSHGMPGS